MEESLTDQFVSSDSNVIETNEPDDAVQVELESNKQKLITLSTFIDKGRRAGWVLAFLMPFLGVYVNRRVLLAHKELNKIIARQSVLMNEELSVQKKQKTVNSIIIPMVVSCVLSIVLVGLLFGWIYFNLFIV